jgi:hypothetical protein
MFGFYTQIRNLFNPDNILTAGIITLGIFLPRWLFFRFVFSLPVVPLVFFAPRGLITILLFISIPAGSRIPLFSEEIVTLVILMTIIVMTIGNLVHKDKSPVIVNDIYKNDPPV